jgi:small conductance mechanosensitive channel
MISSGRNFITLQHFHFLRTTLMDTTKEAIQYLQLTKMWLINNGMDVVMAVIIFFVGRWLARWAADLGQKALLRGGVDETLSRFLNKLSYYALLTAVVIAAADQLGIRTTSFIAILGAAGLAVGLALKDSLANFAAGVMLILFRPFKVGDLVTAAGVTGTVQVIDIFSTIILTADNQKVIVPNNGITSGIITNINSESTRRIDLTVRISHQDNIPKVKDLLTKIMLTEQRILADPAPAIAVAELTDFSVQIVVRPWVKTVDYWDVRFSLTEKIKLTFDKEGISFPFTPQSLQLLQGAGAQR